jgi:glycosyltransferase involved in cell wall biosynthesis
MSLSKHRKLDVGVVIVPPPTFVRGILEEMNRRYHVRVLPEFWTDFPLGRLRRLVNRMALKAMMLRSDVLFVEWASYPLLALPSRGMGVFPHRCKVVTRLHGRELYHWATEIDWHKVDKIIFVSQYLKDEFCRTFSEHSHKAALVENGVDIERFNAPLRPFQGKIGMLGRIHSEKRVYDAILSLAEVLRDSDLHLYLGGGLPEPPCGDVTYWVALHRIVGKLKLESKVTFCGHIQEPEVWFRDIDIFVSNSFFEGQQVALLEAMASRCYCLAHFWDGVEAVLPPENIFTTPNDLQRKLTAFLELPEEEKQRQQERLRAIVEERHNSNMQIPKILGLIDEVTRAGKPDT